MNTLSLHLSFTYCITLSKIRYLGSKITKFKTQKFVFVANQMCIGVTDEIKRLNKKEDTSIILT